MTYEEMYDYLADVLCVDEEALKLAFAIGGGNTKTAEHILFYYTGWKSFEGWLNVIWTGKRIKPLPFSVI